MRMPCTDLHAFICISVEPIEQCYQVACMVAWHRHRRTGGFLVLPYSTVDRLSRGRGV